MNNNRTIELKPLPYSYTDLEPYVSEQALRVHHIRHLGGYTKKLNEMLAQIIPSVSGPLSSLYACAHKLHEDPERLRFLIGAVYNHNLYFSLLSPPENDAIRRPEGDLLSAIERSFGSFERFSIEFADEATAIQGSGWTYLCKDKRGRAVILSVKDHDVPNLSVYTPVAVIDMWEHAYYLDYQNKRAEYVENILNHIINWNFAIQNLNNF